MWQGLWFTRACDSCRRSTAKRQNQLVGKMEAIEEKLKGRGLSRQPSRQTTFQC